MFVSMDIRGQGEGSPTLTTSGTSVYFTDTGIIIIIIKVVDY